MTSHYCKIVDCGASCEVIFFSISPQNLLGAFFDSLAINLLFSDYRKYFDMIFNCSVGVPDSP